MTHYGEIVFSDVVDHCTVNGVVDDVAGHLLAETAFEFSEGNVAFAEAGEHVGAADFLEFFGDLVLIVVFFDRHGKTYVYG